MQKFSQNSRNDASSSQRVVPVIMGNNFIGRGRGGQSQWSSFRGGGRSRANGMIYSGHEMYTNLNWNQSATSYNNIIPTY